MELNSMLKLRIWSPLSDLLENFWESHYLIVPLAKVQFLKSLYECFGASCYLPVTKSSKNLQRWKISQDFPGDPVAKTPCFQCRGHAFDPWPGKFHMPCSQEKKKVPSLRPLWGFLKFIKQFPIIHQITETLKILIIILMKYFVIMK